MFFRFVILILVVFLWCNVEAICLTSSNCETCTSDPDCSARTFCSTLGCLLTSGISELQCSNSGGVYDPESCSTGTDPPPASSPTASPTVIPTASPTVIPTASPTTMPILAPSPAPSSDPSPAPNSSTETIGGETGTLSSASATITSLKGSSNVVAESISSRETGFVVKLPDSVVDSQSSSATAEPGPVMSGNILVPVLLGSAGLVVCFSVLIGCACVIRRSNNQQRARLAAPRGPRSRGAAHSSRRQRPPTRSVRDVNFDDIDNGDVFVAAGGHRRSLSRRQSSYGQRLSSNGGGQRSLRRKASTQSGSNDTMLLPVVTMTNPEPRVAAPASVEENYGRVNVTAPADEYGNLTLIQPSVTGVTYGKLPEPEGDEYAQVPRDVQKTKTTGPPGYQNLPVDARGERIPGL